MKAYEVVIDRILDLLEAGTVPWQRPWDPAIGLPRNIRGTAYRGTPVLLWKWPERTAETDDGREQRRPAPLVRYYRVWNLLQTEGVEVPACCAASVVDLARVSADSVLSQMPAPPVIRHDGGARQLDHLVIARP